MEEDKIANFIGDWSDTDFGDEEIYDVIPDEFDTTTSYLQVHPDKIGGVIWSGGKPVLPFSSLCDKTKSIFTMVKGIPIEIRENDGENYICPDKSSYVINIANKPRKGINKYTAFNHELAHYAFDSCNTDLVEFIKDELDKIPAEHKDKALEIYRSVFNVIEDQRVESLLGETYLGTGMRFRQTRRRIGEMRKDVPAQNPLDALHCSREFKEELIPKEWESSKEVMSEVEMKDKEASLIFTKKYIQEHVNPWILGNLENFDSDKKCAKDEEKPIKASSELEELFKQTYQSNRECDHRELESDSTDKILAKLACDNLGDSKKLSEVLKELQKRAEDRIQMFKDKIEEEARNAKVSFCPNADKIEITSRDTSGNKPRPNMSIAKSINKILKLLQAKYRPRIKDVGEEISIPEVIRRKARGYGDVFINKKHQHRLAIVVSIDASGSMNGEPIQIARDMMATLFKSVEGVKGIDIKAIVWAGDNQAVGITNVNNLKECRFIHTHHNRFGGTPTTIAVEYSERVIEQMKAKKKLLVVITDGYPNGTSTGEPAEQAVRKEVNRARKKGIATLGLWVGGVTGDENMDIMFGKGGYIGVNDMEEASDEVITRFRKVVLNQFK